MTDTHRNETVKRPRRWRKWLGLGLGLMVVVVVAAAAALPWALGTEPARRVLLGRINEAMAPGRVEVVRFRFSYTRPLVMEGFVVRAPGGETVLSAKKGEVDRTIGGLMKAAFGLAADRVVPIRLTLAEAALDIKRAEDGTINLAEALQALFRGDPRKKPGDIRIKMIGGSVRVGAEASSAAFEAGLDGLDLHLPHHGGPAEWEIRLVSPGHAGGGKMSLTGSAERSDREGRKAGDFDVVAKVAEWPIALESQGFRVSGKVSAEPRISLRNGRWVGDGEFRLIEFEARNGPAEPGEPFGCREIAGQWAVAPAGPSEGSEGIRVVASLAAEDGLILPEDLKRVVGTGASRAAVELIYWQEEGRAEIKASHVEIPTGRLDLSGVLTGLLGSASGFEVDARFEPDGEQVNEAMAARLMDSEWRIERPKVEVRARGPIDPVVLEDPVGRLDLDLRASFDRLQWTGLDVEGAEIAARIEAGEVRLEPIRTTVNGGTLEIHPELVRTESGGLSLILTGGSRVDRAGINQELSQNILAFAVPILERATHPTGYVSVDVERAEIPLISGEEGKVDPELEAALLFEAVEFGPGPLALAILDLVGQGDARLRLDQPVALLVTGGRVYSEGVSIPVAGEIVRVEVDGSVGLDKTIDLTARLPITRKMLGDLPVLSDLLAGSGLAIPISGTLDDPKVDRLALDGQLQQIASGAIDGAAKGIRGIGEMFSRMKERREARRQERERRRSGSRP